MLIIRVKIFNFHIGTGTLLNYSAGTRVPSTTRYRYRVRVLYFVGSPLRIKTNALNVPGRFEEMNDHLKVHTFMYGLAKDCASTFLSDGTNRSDAN